MITTLMLPEQRVHAEMLPLRIGSLHAEPTKCATRFHNWSGETGEAM